MRADSISELRRALRDDVEFVPVRFNLEPALCCFQEEIDRGRRHITVGPSPAGPFLPNRPTHAHPTPGPGFRAGPAPGVMGPFPDSMETLIEMIGFVASTI
jgi:hypothetical protein